MTSQIVWESTEICTSGSSPCASASVASDVLRARCFSARAAGSIGPLACISWISWRSSRIFPATSISAFHFFWSPSSRTWTVSFSSAISFIRSAWSRPIRDSRSRTFSSRSIWPMRRVASSTAGGLVVRPMATRAQAVSSTLTDLSGSCRPLR